MGGCLMNNFIFEAKNISHWIPHHGWLFTNVSLVIKKGEVLCLFGKNGSGKSSLIKSLVGFFKEKNHEKIFLDGKALITLKPEEQNNFWAWLPQNVLQPQKYQLEEFLNLPFPHVVNPLPTEEVMDYFEIKHLRNTEINFLSGGEWKRAQLARLWRTNARLLFLDEPDAGLDFYQKKKLQQKIKKQQQEKGTSFIIATHDIAWGLKMCDQFEVLSDMQLKWSSQNKEITLDCVQSILLKTYGEKVFLP